MRPPTPGIPVELGLLVARTRTLLWRVAARGLEQAGESMHVYRVLGQLTKGGPTTQRDLADATAQHPAGVSRLLDELERSGDVQRRRDATDRRRLIVEATAKGKRRYGRMRPQVSASMEQVMSGLRPAERVTLQRLLEKVLAASAT